MKRPVSKNTKKSTSFSLRPSTIELLKDEAWKRRVSASELVEELINELRKDDKNVKKENVR